MPVIPFSDSLRKVLAQSRLTAFALGGDRITSLHFLVADCQLHPISSLKGLLFASDTHFQRFCEELRQGPPLPPAGSLALTTEAEKALKAAQRVCRQYQDNTMDPCHLLVAASQNPKSVVSHLLANTNIASGEVATYYVRKGQLFPKAAPAAGPLTLIGKLRQLVGLGHP